jgi:excisionase family DNA binding protein
MSARHPRENPRPGTAPSAAAPPGAEEAEPGPPAERLAYSVDEAARLTGLSRDLLYDQMRQGNLDYLKVGRRRLITRQHLEQFLAITPSPGHPRQRPGTRGADPVQA